MSKKRRKVNKESVSYWKRKCDTLFSDIERAAVGECQMCGKLAKERKSDGLKVVGLDLHHMVERDRIRYRYIRDNVVILCTACHGAVVMYANRARNAHGSRGAVEKFYHDLAIKCPEKEAFYQKHKDEPKHSLDENGHIIRYTWTWYRGVYYALEKQKSRSERSRK